MTSKSPSLCLIEGCGYLHRADSQYCGNHECINLVCHEMRRVGRNTCRAHDPERAADLSKLAAWVRWAETP